MTTRELKESLNRAIKKFGNNDTLSICGKEDNGNLREIKHIETEENIIKTIIGGTH